MGLFGFGKKKPEAVVPLDFENILKDFQKLSPTAQTTFLYRLVGVLPKKVAETLQKYVSRRLSNDTSNGGRQGQHNPRAKTPRSEWS